MGPTISQSCRGVLEGQAVSCLIPATSLPFSLCTSNTLHSNHTCLLLSASPYAMVLPPQDLCMCCFLGLELSLFPHNVYFSHNRSTTLKGKSLLVLDPVSIPPPAHCQSSQ